MRFPRPPGRGAHRSIRMVAGAAFATAGLALAGAGVFAGLNATAANTSPQQVNSGTLKLTMAAATGSAGFTTTLSNVAPGDVVNRYVDLTNGGTLDGQALTLGASDSTPTKLTTDATNGLRVSVTQCSGAAWAVSTGTCGPGGTTSVLANNVAVSSLSAPATLIAGSVPAGTVLRLQVAISLPNQNETTVNGVLPTSTIQGLTANLTWTFSEAQRAATTTNS
ncbi:MAG: hypothetical protein M3445_11780 [Actinomycetota bacterium]|nr:hypothetical protein [Actinomycetota bacterium]